LLACLNCRPKKIKVREQPGVMSEFRSFVNPSASASATATVQIVGGVQSSSSDV
jgi:hypothetical protein